MNQSQHIEFDEVIKAGLKNLSLRPGCGRVVRQNPTNGSKFILLFEDDPQNWSARLSIEKSIHWFLRKNLIQLVGVEGATLGYINTTKLTSFPVAEVKEDVALYFLKELKINAGEYCHTIYEKPYYASFYLCGVDDKNLYKKSLDLFLSQKMPEFINLQNMRATRMLDNILHYMEELNRNRAALICSGYLPDILCKEMEKQDISYAIIKPVISEPSDFVKYGKHIRGELSPLEKILHDNLNKNDSINPKDGKTNSKPDVLKPKPKVLRRERIQAITPEYLRRLTFRITSKVRPNGKSKAIICLPSMFIGFKKREFALFVPVPYDEDDFFLRASWGLDPIGYPSCEALSFFREGNYSLKLQQYNNAIENYTRAIDIEPKFVLAYYNRGVTSNLLGNNNDAITDYTRVIEIDPSYALAYMNRGNIYDSLHQHGEAVANYSCAIKHDPTSAAAYYNRAISYTKQYNYYNSLKDFNSATELDPMNANIYISRGVCYDKLDEFDKALDNYKYAIKLDSTNGLAHYNVGVLFYNKGRVGKGIRYLNKAAKLGYAR